MSVWGPSGFSQPWGEGGGECKCNELIEAKWGALPVAPGQQHSNPLAHDSPHPPFLLPLATPSAAAARQAHVAQLLTAFWRRLRDAPPGQRLPAPLSLRDLLSWVVFINETSPTLGPQGAYVHGAYLAVLDGLGLMGGGAAGAAVLQRSCHQLLLEQLPEEQRWVGGRPLHAL